VAALFGAAAVAETSTEAADDRLGLLDEETIPAPRGEPLVARGDEFRGDPFGEPPVGLWD
jgi:hypothetical protein